ncbi:MAG: Hsp20/alpha crystallin family protein [Bacteroidales bacterium]|jgi:HSP20 family protein|nr:Hsp20/alpha crystallin family protein [Bacteroidales bacterium]
MTSLIRRQQNWLPDVFNDFFDNDWLEHANYSAPAINVKENKENYLIEVAAPGMTKEDFNIRLDEDNDLVITMEKKNDKKDEEKDTHYIRCEFSYSKFQQAMVLPKNVNKEKISARVDNGVLKIFLPKYKADEAKPDNKLISIE